MRHSFRKCKECGSWRWKKETCPCTTQTISQVVQSARPDETVNAMSIEFNRLLADAEARVCEAESV